MQNVLLHNAPPGYLIEEIHRKDIHIHEQNKKIEILELELARSKQRIDELQTTLSKCNDSGYKSAQGRYWSVDEHQRFLEGLKRYGAKDVKSISQHVGTRNATQVRTHAQKYFLRLEKEKGEENVNSPNSDEISFNNNKEKDDESDAPEDTCSDKDPNPNNDNNTQSETTQGEDRSPASSTPPATEPKLAPSKKSPTKSKSAPPKSKKKGKRKATTMSMQLGEATTASDVPIKSENFVPFKTAQHLPAAPLTSFLPTYGVLNHSNAMAFGSNIALCNKIIAETSETILYNMKHWTPQDYALFVEGLISVQEEKDNTSKCITIRDKFLPQFPLDDILKCYSLLQNVAMKETQQATPYYMVSPITETAAVVEMDPKRMRLISPTPEMSHFGSVSPFGISESSIIRTNPYHSGAFPISHVRYPAVQYGYQGHSEAFFPPTFPPLMEHTNGARISTHSGDLRMSTNEGEYDSHY